MITIAVISDIHGNLPALTAVMADLNRMTPDQVVVNGDMIGRGPQSRETLDVIRETGWPAVLGNHEEFLAACARGDCPSDWEEGWWNPIRMAMSTLSPDCFAWMEKLPFTHIVEMPGAPPIQMVHGSPRRSTEGFYLHDTDAHILTILNGVPYPVVVGAHTHVPLTRQVGGYHVLNSGSVGAPFNGDPTAQYLLLTWDGQAWSAEIRRVAYDRGEVLRLWRETGFWDSGVAAQVFAYEVETATFHFWHYVRYCHEHGLALNDRCSFNHYLENGHIFEYSLSRHDLTVDHAPGNSPIQK
jgi:predicted phosphodiesterase